MAVAPLARQNDDVAVNVLLSHSIADADGPLASRLRAVAASYGVVLVLPERRPASSRALTLPKSTTSAIEHADAVLALVTRGSDDRKSVEAEVTAAIKHKKPLVLLTEVSMDLPSLRGDVHVVHFDRKSPTGHEAALGAALQALQKRSGRKRAESAAMRNALAIGAIAGIAVGLLALGLANTLRGPEDTRVRVE